MSWDGAGRVGAGQRSKVKVGRAASVGRSEGLDIAIIKELQKPRKGTGLGMG